MSALGGIGGETKQVQGPRTTPPSAKPGNDKSPTLLHRIGAATKRILAFSATIALGAAIGVGAVLTVVLGLATVLGWAACLIIGTGMAGPLGFLIAFFGTVVSIPLFGVATYYAGMATAACGQLASELWDYAFSAPEGEQNRASKKEVATNHENSNH